MTRFIYRFQFLIDRIDESIRLSREDRSRVIRCMDQTHDEIGQLNERETRIRESLHCLAESFIDRLDACESAGEEWMMHRIRHSGLLQGLEQIETDRRRLRKCLREQTAELAEIDDRLADFQRERRQFERNRTAHEQRNVMDENRQVEKNTDEAGRIIWHRNRSDSCEQDQN